MASRDEIEKVSDLNLKIGESEFEKVSKNTSQDFNFRKQGKTYFSIKRIRVKNISSVKIISDSEAKLLIAFRKD
ncbi:hypothetical protein STRCR_1716 [Streptococcus criceti HS-6]|uniref:Uncharacterized protein n=1 Tax=Streptococcus criceti HS-6 TaxID=873449 RepID=G5JPY1_STRCG|nr:hypothetical protein STRCR_1716 [Streptococcus criceti HS-6]